MELKKRDCNIKIRIEPLGAYLMEVVFDFGDSKLEYMPSSAMSGQFGDFVSALYTLYTEGFDGHNDWHQKEYHSNGDHRVCATTTKVLWDAEGTCMEIEMYKEVNGDTIRIRTRKDFRKTYNEYIVNDRDFCYAVSKACTEAIKRFGFYGYQYSTGGDLIQMHQLLFLKAYALGKMQARQLKVLDKDYDCRKSNFEREMEIFLFDM